LAASDTAILKDILRACALEYNDTTGAPRVKWYAEGDAAERMIEVARKHGVKIEKNQEEGLLLALKSVKIGREIPPEIYLAVARIYAYLIGQSAVGQSAGDREVNKSA